MRAFVLQPGDNGEISQGIRDAFPSCFTTAPTSHGSSSADTLSSSPMIFSMTHPTKQNLPSIKEMMTSNRISGNVDKIVLELPKPEDTCYCLATSGSTGDPKFVVHTHNSMVNMLQIYSEMLTQGSPASIRHFNDRSCSWAAAFYALPVVSGSAHICTDPEYTTKRRMTNFVCNILREEQISHTLIIPYLLYDIINNPDGDQAACLTRLETVFVTGERVQKELLEKAIRVAPNLCMLYGLTEVGALLTAPVSPDGVTYKATSATVHDVTHITYIAHPRVQFRLLNPDEGGCGEIQIHGPVQCCFHVTLTTPKPPNRP